jgi:hypothetical protein
MANPIGPLGPADESLTHQIVDTFATVGQSDLAWTEKVCAMACARDGSLQLGFGLGKYPNRNVMDGYGGVSRGREQLTVRASRALSSDREATTVGPVHYEVLEPMRTVRFRLEPDDVQPVAFEWTFTAELPPFTEDRTHQRSLHGRVNAELVRYHQIGVASGWVELDGERSTFADTEWVSTRDHSWGVRYDVGATPPDLEPTFDVAEVANFNMVWSPVLMERPDGSRYGLFLHFVDIEVPGFYEQHSHTAGVEHRDGTFERFTALRPDLRYDTANRRLLGGTITATQADGSERRLGIEALGDTGFHLGAGLYFGYAGHHHGEYRGELHTEGERIADCTVPDVARALHQIRDTVVRVTDPVGGGVGVSNCQPIITGTWPELGLTADTSWI